MAQSSNYKQYNRTTRVLTEESGFAGGMLWTGNNIDETHLKAVVNCDYDDTTGYLKTRDPFEVYKAISPTESELSALDITLEGYSLLGAYNICAFDEDDNTTNAGWLYIFSNSMSHSGDTSWVNLDVNTAICLFLDQYKQWHVCDIRDLTDTAQLCNVDKTQLLTLYDNYLYGISVAKADANDWLQVFYLKTANDEESPETYKLCKLSNEEVQSKIDSVTLTEACATGFNAARTNPFEYTGKQVDNSGDISIQGVYLTDDKGTVIVSPTLGVTYNLNVIVNYQNDNGYLSVFEFKSTSDTVAADTASVWAHRDTMHSRAGLFTFKYAFNTKKTTLMFTYYGINNPYYELLAAQPDDWGTTYKTYFSKDATTGAYNPLTTEQTAPAWASNTYYQRVEPAAYSSNALDYFGPYTITASDNTQNLKLKQYNLNTSNGSCVWKNRMCLWGTEGNYNCLFLSEVDNFYYYPIPHNVALFETNVISCIPYKDTLLVFTANKIYRMSENNDGTFTQTVIQNDMPLTKEDAAQLTAIKNMILFKSGNYFYMIVPKSQSLTDELSVAPIYKNIAGFLNNLDKSVLDMLQLLYPEYYFVKPNADSNLNNEPFKILNNGNPVAVYSEQDTVHILYDIKADVQTKESDTITVIKFKMFLNYNTNLRAWTLYVEDTTNQTLEVAVPTAERRMSFVRINTNTGVFSIVTKQTVNKFENKFRILLDTGYRTLSSTMQKRFREVQLKLYNANENITAFGTAFLVDGEWRRSYSKLQEHVTSDGIVTLMPELDLNTFVTELSMPVNAEGVVEKAPGSDAIELGSWELNFSHFKREAPVTVRIPVSGKGFNPRFILMAPVNTELTINEVNWVYRLMHGR
jgi:hypothetical protein